MSDELKYNETCEYCGKTAEILFVDYRAKRIHHFDMFAPTPGGIAAVFISVFLPFLYPFYSWECPECDAECGTQNYLKLREDMSCGRAPRNWIPYSEEEFHRRKPKHERHADVSDAMVLCHRREYEDEQVQVDETGDRRSGDDGRRRTRDDPPLLHSMKAD